MCKHVDLKRVWDKLALQSGLTAVAPDEPKLSTKMVISYLSQNFIFSSERVAELGCGIGRLMPGIYHNGTPELYVGIDWSRLMLRRARQKTLRFKSRAQFLLADITDALPFRERTFDSVIVWTTLVHILDDASFEKALIQASRLSNSRLLICDPTCSDYDIPIVSQSEGYPPSKRRRKVDYYRIVDEEYEVETNDISFGSHHHPESLRTVFLCHRKR